MLLLLLLALRFRHARTHRLSNHGVELTSRVVVGLLYPHLGLRRRWSLTVRHFACLGLITEHFGRFSSRSGNARLCANDKQAGRRALRQVSPTPHRQARRIGTVPSRRRAVQVILVWEALRKRAAKSVEVSCGWKLFPSKPRRILVCTYQYHLCPYLKQQMFLLWARIKFRFLSYELFTIRMTLCSI